MELDMTREGTPWWVWVNLSQGAFTPGLELVIPPANKQGVIDTTHAGRQLMVNKRIIVTGWAWDFVAGAADVGFDLEFRDFSVSPGVTRTLWRTLSQGAAQVQGSITGMFIPLPAGKYGSPGDLTSVGNSASLFVNTTATAPTGGGLLVEGILTEGEWRPGKQFTGSPLQM